MEGRSEVSKYNTECKPLALASYKCSEKKSHAECKGKVDRFNENVKKQLNDMSLLFNIKCVASRIFRCL